MKNKLFILITVLVIAVFAGILYFARPQQAREKAADPTREIIHANMKALEKAQAEQPMPVGRIVASDHKIGFNDSAVEIIVYCDYNDLFCAEYYDDLRVLVDEYDNKITVAFRHFPLPTGQVGFTAALAAECANVQGVYWEASEALYDLKKGDNLSNETIMDTVGALAVDKDKFLACLEDEERIDELDKTVDAAERFGVYGVPTTYVDGVPLPGKYPLDDFIDSQERQRKGLRAIIDEKLEPKQM